MVLASRLSERPSAKPVSRAGRFACAQGSTQDSKCARERPCAQHLGPHSALAAWPRLPQSASVSRCRWSTYGGLQAPFVGFQAEARHHTWGAPPPRLSRFAPSPTTTVGVWSSRSLQPATASLVSTSVMARAPLPPRPVAAVAVAAAAAATAAATRALVGGGWLAAVAASGLAAVLTAVAWPRFATDTLGVHGTSFATPTSGGDWPLLGRLAELAAGVKNRRMCFLFADWRAAAGAPNYQVWTGGTRRIFITNPIDVRYVLARADPPRDTSVVGVLGLVVSPQVLLLTSGDIHTRSRRLLQAPLNADSVLAMAVRVVVAEVGGRGGRLGRALASAAAASGDAAEGSTDTSAGTTLCLSQLFERMTLSVIHHVMVSQPLPSDEILDKLNSTLPLAAPVQMVPAPSVFAPRATARLRALGDYFISSYQSHEAARRSAYADGSWDPVPPKDILDVLLADVDEPKGAYRGDRRRLAADYMLLLSAGYDTTVRGEGELTGCAIFDGCPQLGSMSLAVGSSRHSLVVPLCLRSSVLLLLHLEWCDCAVPLSPASTLCSGFVARRLSSVSGSLTRLGRPYPLPPP